MKFKGSIYITDPSYIAKGDDWADDNGFDPMDETIHCPEFTDYLIKSTGIGDGSWKVYELDPSSKYSYIDIHKIIEKGDYSKYNVVGEFCVDSANACVVYQHETNAYNPLFMAEFHDKPQYWTLIEDFEGEIEAYYDPDGELHLIGIGNCFFFTA